MAKLLKSFNPALAIQRQIASHKYNWNGEGVQYPGFKYYPRHKDFKDPPYEPSKLFRVERIKPLKGIPFWEKNILAEFKLVGKQKEPVVIKNIPENNQRLWKVKHLIKITPITFPDGFPKDIYGTTLQENGELKVIKKVELEEKRLALTTDFQNETKKIDGDTLRRSLRHKWLSGWE